MRRAALKTLPAALVPLALAWVGAARGVAPPAWLVVATVVVVGTLVAWRLGEGTTWHVPLSWLAGLVGWAALAAAVRPVAPAPAAWLVAIGVVAVGLALFAANPRGAAWSATAVVAAGAACAGWLIVERLTVAARPAGPFGNPNPAATVPLLALAFVPWLRCPVAIRIGLGVPLVAGVLASGSRGGLLGLLALGVAWGLASSGPRVRRAAAIVALVAAVVLALRLAADRDPLRFERLRIWRTAAAAALAELPLGAGPSGFVDAVLPHNFPRDGEVARYHRIPALAESDYLQLAATLGLPGLACGLGLALAVVRRLRDPRGFGVAAALAATSAVNTQLIVPAVGWVATLAVAAVLPRPRGRPVRLAPPLTAALLLAVTVPVAVALRWPSAGLGGDPAALIARADAAWSGTLADPALADAEALAWRATRLAPRSGRAWRTLAAVQLERARRRGDADLARAAAAGFAEARRVNPLDAWAALGEGQAHRMVGEPVAARTALEAAVRLEPNFVPAWLELALLDLERGDLARVNEALVRIAAARQRRIPAAFVSDYERSLLGADPVLLQRVQAAAGARR